MRSRGIFAVLTIVAALTSADDGYTPPDRPETHGSLVNNGAASTVEVLVLGCQGWPIEGAKVVLVGLLDADELGGGRYVFPDVYAAEQPYRLYAFASAGTVSDTALHVDMTTAVIRAEVMLDLCIETELTTFNGVVRDARGKPVANARVSVDDLFIETFTDKKGRYSLDVPPGDWTLAARAGDFVASVVISCQRPDEPGGAPQEKTADIRLETAP